jgi:hypothetical protein
MTAKEIHCTCCGLKGEIEYSCQDLNAVRVKMFKHKGHDPFTGQIYYHCPGCSTILQVDPMDILNNRILKGISSQQNKMNFSLRGIYSYFFQNWLDWKKVFINVRSS